MDLESAGFGTPAIGGGRLALAFPLGNLVLAARAGVEAEPRPNATSPVYWRGTTLRGGLALTASTGETSVTASVDATRSTADSLSGRNLFPGGGSVTLQVLAQLSVLDPFDLAGCIAAEVFSISKCSVRAPIMMASPGSPASGMRPRGNRLIDGWPRRAATWALTGLV